MLVLIDNGHGINTPGKCSPDAANGLLDSPLFFKEWAWTREIAIRLNQAFTECGIDSSLIVTEDTDVPLKERVRRVNEICDRCGVANVILISIHNNAAGSGRFWMSARGCSSRTPSCSFRDR